MKNGRKNGFKKGNPLTQFSSDNQLSGDAKSQGWQRRLWILFLQCKK
jgi:hypothetical protein